MASRVARKFHSTNLKIPFLWNSGSVYVDAGRILAEQSNLEFKRRPALKKLAANHSDNALLTESPSRDPTSISLNGSGIPKASAEALSSERTEPVESESATADEVSHASSRRSPLLYPSEPKNRLSTGSGQLLLELFPQSMSCLNDMLDSYFTLRFADCEGQTEFIHISDIRYGSRNPSWQLLPETIAAGPFTFDPGRYILSLWGRKSGDPLDHAPSAVKEFRLIWEWEVDFSSMQYVGPTLSNQENAFPTNSLLIEFSDGFYAPSTSELDDVEEMLPVKVEPHKVKKSEKLECIRRIVAAQKELVAVQNDIAVLHEKSEALFSAKSKTKVTLKEMKEVLALRNQQLRESGPDREQTRHSLDLRQAELSRTKLGCVKSQAHISFRQRRLIFDMKTIYPIEQQKGFDDEKISTALGYTAHLVIMIATYLEVPLRYPINPMSSRSMILDRISMQFSGSKEFPLYLKGVDRLRFEYGVFLLNKDIEQLMNYVGINVTNLRNTLPNLKGLIDAVGEDADSPTDEDSLSETVSPALYPPESSYSALKSPLTSANKAQTLLSSNYGPDSNHTFTAESSLRILKPIPDGTGDDDALYSTTSSHLDEFVGEAATPGGKSPTSIALPRPSVVTAQSAAHRLPVPSNVSSAASFSPQDFWPDA
ncbi:hypothetical protein HDU96_009815 [Phlyctochytrium bullatum]|nr:hypothetical protein HDU96_009815 [Phlyctochytrium bullatum]